MTWIAIASLLVVWLVGIVLRAGQSTNLFLLAAAVVLIAHVIAERRSVGD